MRSLLCLAAAGLALACAPPCVPSHVALATEIADKTVALVTEGRAYCSGVWLSEHRILTAGHCVADVSLGESVEYMTPHDVGEAARPARLLVLDIGHDLALLLASSPPEHTSAEIERGELRQGAAVFTMSQPLGLWWSFSSGEISAVGYRPQQGLNIRYVQATAPVSPGSSGCGLFNARGRLVGVAQGIFPRGEQVNVFIHRDYVVELVGALT